MSAIRAGGGQHLGGAESQNQVVHLQAVRHGRACLLHVACGLSGKRQALGCGRCQQGLQPVFDQARHVVVQAKQPLPGLAGVAAKELIAAVAGQQFVHAIRLRHVGAVVGGQGR